MVKLIERVEKALDTIRPYLEADGGNVRILKIDDHMNLELELIGNCSTCPMSAMTLKAGVEETIKREIPEIKNVTAMNVTLSKISKKKKSVNYSNVSKTNKKYIN